MTEDKTDIEEKKQEKNADDEKKATEPDSAPQESKEIVKVETKTPTIEEYLREEIKKERKSLFWTRAGGGGLVLFIFFYLWTFVYEPYRKTVLNPTNLGKAFVYFLDDQLMGHLETTEVKMKAMARPLAQQAAGDIRALVPLIGEYGVQHVDVITSYLSQLDRITITLTDLYFEKYEDDIRAYVDEYGKEEFVEKFADDMVSGLLYEVEEILELHDEGANHNTVGLIMEVGQEVGRLADKDAFNMTLSERLQRRLIVAWTHFLADAAGELMDQAGGPVVHAPDIGMARMDPQRILARIGEKGAAFDSDGSNPPLIRRQ